MVTMSCFRIIIIRYVQEARHQQGWVSHTCAVLQGFKATSVGVDTHRYAYQTKGRKSKAGQRAEKPSAVLTFRPPNPHLVGVLGCLRKVTMPADADIDLINLSTLVLAGPNPQNLPGQVAAAHDMDGLYLQSNLSVPSGRLHEAHLTGPRWESCRDRLFREVSVACVSLSETHIRRPLPSACQPSSVVRTQA